MQARAYQNVAVGVGIGVNVGLMIVGGSLYFLLGRSRKASETRGQSTAVLYVNGKSEMDAEASRTRFNRNHEVHRPPIELDGANATPF